MKVSIMSAIGFFLCSLNVHAEIKDKIERTFTVPIKSELRLENVNGDVDIQAWDKGEIEVTATVTAKNEASREQVEIKMNEHARGVDVITHYKKNKSWGKNFSVSVDYAVKVPRDLSLKSVELVNGSFNAKDVEGEVNVELVNGSATLTGLTSDTEISSVNGSIEARFDKVSDELKHISIDTINGKITLVVPDDISADIDIETMHGNITNDFDLPTDKSIFSGKSVRGKINDGKVNISIETVNGGVRLLSH